MWIATFKNVVNFLPVNSQDQQTLARRSHMPPGERLIKEGFFENQIQKIKTINLIISSIEKVLIFSFIVAEITQKLYLESEKELVRSQPLIDSCIYSKYLACQRMNRCQSLRSIS